MKNHAAEFPIKKMAQVFKISRAGYYKHINKIESLTKQHNKKLAEKIKSIYRQNRGLYGSPRIHAVLKKQGESYSRKRIAKVMQQENIQAKTSRKWKAIAQSSRCPSTIVPNILNQNFVAYAENKVWVTDVTYIETAQGWLYLSAVLDLFSRKVVGLCMDSSMDVTLVVRSLSQAICHRAPGTGLILHSDRGAQYTSLEYQNFAHKRGFRISMSAKGCCYDNAVMESFFHTLKNEHTNFCFFRTKEEAIKSIFEYIEVFYNRQRLHSTLNFQSPVDFELQKIRSYPVLGLSPILLV